MVKTNCGGFTLLELVVAMGISVGVLGASGMLAAQMQSAYQFQVETAEAKQEGRYAIEWIERYVRSAGNNPFVLAVTPCPVAGTAVLAIRFDPDGDGLNDDIRLQSDTAPVNGRIGGSAGACTEPGEDVTITYNPALLAITLTDNNVGKVAEPRTDNIVSSLLFVYRDGSHNITTIANNVAYVETVATVRSRVNQPGMKTPAQYILRSETRVRNR